MGNALRVGGQAARLVQQHQRAGRGGREDARRAPHMARERRQALLQALPVADVRKHVVKVRDRGRLCARAVRAPSAQERPTRLPLGALPGTHGKAEQTSTFIYIYCFREVTDTRTPTPRQPTFAVRRGATRKTSTMLPGMRASGPCPTVAWAARSAPAPAVTGRDRPALAMSAARPSAFSAAVLPPVFCARGGRRGRHHTPAPCAQAGSWHLPLRCAGPQAVAQGPLLQLACSSSVTNPACLHIGAATAFARPVSHRCRPGCCA
jgi:hypothetical protein